MWGDVRLMAWDALLTAKGKRTARGVYMLAKRVTQAIELC